MKNNKPFILALLLAAILQVGFIIYLISAVGQLNNEMNTIRRETISQGIEQTMIERRIIELELDVTSLKGNK